MRGQLSEEGIYILHTILLYKFVVIQCILKCQYHKVDEPTDGCDNFLAITWQTWIVDKMEHEWYLISIAYDIQMYTNLQSNFI